MIAIGLIGYGGIAKTVLHLLPKLAPDRFRIVGLLGKPGMRTRAAALDVPAFDDLDMFLATRPRIVAECAGHGAVAVHGEAVLRSGADLLLISTGALADRNLWDRLTAAVHASGSRLILAAGAIGAVDALTAAKAGGLDAVRYRSIKPPLAWKGTPAESVVDLDRLTAATVFYRGNARDAARAYPKNANVAATVALAGLGFEATEVELVADPQARGNLHRIEAEGAFGRFSFEIDGKPLTGNPKTSSLAAFSVAQAIARTTANVIV